ncbi:MAG: NADH:flavin oxidoreductase [bacterium]|nr:NADH:flavin oxidoreductase [bacterium]
MKQLSDPLKLRNLTLKNRLVRSATWEGAADRQGHIDEHLLSIYKELAQGGTALIIGGFTSVSDSDVYIEGVMRLAHDDIIPEYRKLTDIVHQENCAIIAQLALGAYYRQGKQIEPNFMTAEDIQTAVQQFINAAVRAEKAGFDGVQIHAAHFFFLSRFISPKANRRTDQYGGSSENRLRILLEIMEGIRQAAPSLHITIKINSSDFTYGGLDNDESLYICQRLAGAGIDSIEVSGNGTSVAGIRPHRNEAYFLEFAAQLAQQVSTPIILVGGLRSRDTMEKILNTTKIELLSLSRPLLREPDFSNRLLSEKDAISPCISCNNCYSSYYHECIFRK